MKRLLFAGAVAVLAATGCHKDAPRSDPATQGGPATAEPSAIAADSEEIPTEEDFQDEAQQKVTDQNLDDELDKLEKEIGQ